jgi:hypothetical protein
VQHQPPDAATAEQRAIRGATRRAIRRDALLAIAVAALLTLCWAAADWARLSHLLLPDPDDMLRLQQVRDWLAGQATNDWTQHRMAPPLGTPMHWSRVGDLGPAALILLVSPVAGRHAAELVAVIAYPALLFAAALFLAGRLARILWRAEAAPIAILLAALAYPGTTVFIPGRIDHHALQVVLVMIAALALARAASWRTGVVAGAAVAISLVVGLETAPQLAALLAIPAAAWVVRGSSERARLGGLAAGLGGATLPFVLFLRPWLWDPALCDAFTPATAQAALAGAAALGLLAVATPRLAGWSARAGAGALAAAVVLGTTLHAFPGCLAGPYGRMDPLLRTVLLPHIDEANGVFAQAGVAAMLAYGGVLFAGAAASVWMLARAPRRWTETAPVAAVVLASALVALAQVRGAYVGAPLAAPVLAGVVLAARARGSALLVAGAWLGSAGLAWYQLPAFVAHATATTPPPAPAGGACDDANTWDQVARLPAGATMASISMAPYLIAATPLSAVGAGYHRNDRGNVAMYRFFLASPEASRAIGQAWRVRYVAFCPGDFDELDPARAHPASLAAALAAERAPSWLRRVRLHGTRLRFYRVAE